MPLSSDKITLCWPNLVRYSTLSGGSFGVDTPLEYAKDEVLSVKATTTDALAASTWCDVTLNRIRPVQVVAVAAHNFSSTAQAQVQVYSEVDELLYDSGVFDVWPPLYQTAQLEWEYDNFWSGRLDEEERGQFTPLMTHFLPDVTMAKRVRISLFDEDNPDGHLSFGRVFVADAWQPAINASWGIQHGFDADDEFTEAEDRTEYAYVKRLRRTVQMSLSELDEGEAYQRLFSMDRTEGQHGEILYAFSVDPKPENFVRTFLARQRQLSPIKHPEYANHATDLSLLEVL